jgi:hypothetical protein
MVCLQGMHKAMAPGRRMSVIRIARYDQSGQGKASAGLRLVLPLLFSLLDFEAFPPVFPHGVDENVLQARIALLRVRLQLAEALFCTGD